MALFMKPNTPEWFEALELFNPDQAAITRQIISLAGREDVCSVCGDDESKDYKLESDNLPSNAVATLRLCKDCKQIRSSSGESFKLMTQ